ncbi:MAG: glycosyltransferase [Polyangiaceae bacterium]
MKIAIVTNGTRGDVQPYLAVALALTARGHTVKLAAPEDHRELVRAYGVEHFPLRGSMRELLSSELGQKWLNSAGSPRLYARYARELFVPLQERHCVDADAAVEGADGVVGYGLAFGALHAAERRQLPLVTLSPWPMVPSRAITPPGAAFLDPAPGVLKYALGHALWWVAYSALSEPHRRYRKRIGLPPLRAPDIFHAVIERSVATIHLFSEAILSRPADWAARHHVAGYAFAPPLTFEPSRALSDFLRAGPAPVYIGFGSMTGMSRSELVELAIATTRRASVRAIVATGWGGPSDGLPNSDDLYFVDELPHDWLFPRVRAVVHHGGAGTFAAGLRAGKPTVVAAFFGDQPFWGQINHALGAGPPPLTPRTLRADTLASAIRRTLTGLYDARAAALGERLRREDGAAKAAELIERALAR